MKWKKIGKIYELNVKNDFLVSHTSNPIAIQTSNDVFRIFFSGRNANNKSSIGYFDYNITTNIIINTCKKPIFTYGENNSYYSHGLSLGNHYEFANNIYVSFMGWEIPNNGHWRGSIGLLRLINIEKMIIASISPLLQRDSADPLSFSYPWIMNDNNILKMWYGSTQSWDSCNGEMIHPIKLAISSNGNNWKKIGNAIPYKIGVAQAFSRPSVLKNNFGYHMWYSFRPGTGKTYRIGYSHSSDGLIWDRVNDAGIDVSQSGWDSEMICYPFVFRHNYNTYMLYNGNNFGKSGIGLAILEQF